MKCQACASEVPEGTTSCISCWKVVDAEEAPGPVPSDRATQALAGNKGNGKHFLPGTILAGRYRIVSLLGCGGMGAIYRADDVKLDVPVALKLLPDPLAGDETSIRLLLNEVRLARQVSHPNVCRVYDVGEVEGRHLICMEFIDGQDLAALLRREGRLPLARAVEIARGICDGLEAAHQEGILHRDLKPANLMIDKRGRVRITDFGLAVLAETVRGVTAREGTPAYMAPEQHCGREVTVQSDLYALGLVLYELFTGRKTFAADSCQGLARLHREASPAAPSSLEEGLDPAIETVILRCLEKDPRARPASARAVAAALPARDTVTEGAAVKTLLASDILASTDLFEQRGDIAAAELFRRHDRLARDLIWKHGGREIDSGDGFLMLFERPIHAALYAQDYHAAVADLAAAEGLELEPRVGIHLGEVVIRKNAPQDVARGAKPLEAEGLARSMATRLMTLAGGHQTLLSRTAFNLARRSAVDEIAAAESAERLCWLAHGKYLFKGVGEPVEVFEVGIEGKARLTPPPSSEEVPRVHGEVVGVGLYQVVVGDLARFLASGWLRDIDDELLRDDIVDGSPERRLGSVRELAQRLRTLEARRASREADWRPREPVQRGRRRRKVMAVAMGILVVFALAMGVLTLRIQDEAERAEQEAARAKNIARVAVGESWVDKDPTRAALVLLEVGKPDETPLAVTAIRKVLRHQLATLGLRGHEAEVWEVSWSPGGDCIVSASNDGTTRIWDIDVMGDPIVLPHDERVLTASFSPSGDRIVPASADGTARVWAVDGSDQPVVLQGHDHEVLMALFDPGGNRVLTASPDRTVRIWRLDTDELVALIKAGTKVCLDPSFREKYFGEASEEAWPRNADCERSHGRKAEVPPSQQ